jgi:hypothetical protein
MLVPTLRHQKTSSIAEEADCGDDDADDDGVSNNSKTPRSAKTLGDHFISPAPINVKAGSSTAADSNEGSIPSGRLSRNSSFQMPSLFSPNSSSSPSSSASFASLPAAAIVSLDWQKLGEMLKQDDRASFAVAAAEGRVDSLSLIKFLLGDNEALSGWQRGPSSSASPEDPEHVVSSAFVHSLDNNNSAAHLMSPTRASSSLPSTSGSASAAPVVQVVASSRPGLEKALREKINNMEVLMMKQKLQVCDSILQSCVYVGQ